MKVILLLLLICGICLAKQSKVIVIGAGVSGIAGASKLYELNVDVLVIEAEPRIGGRVNSVKFENAFVEIGAEWCHGEEGNIVHELVKDYGILGGTKFGTQFYTSDRKPVGAKFSAELNKIFENIFDPNQKPQDDTTPRFVNAMQMIKKKTDFAFEALEHIQHSVLTSLSAFSWFDPSALIDYEFCPGDQNLHWSGNGYKTVLEILMKKFPKIDPSFEIENKIILNQQVKKIYWGTNGVNVSCSDGSVYNADHIIFTPSLGVLKNKHKSLFLPRLPISKENAIRYLGFGAVIKVMMHFPTRWWPVSNFTDFTFVWKYHDREMLLVEFPHGPTLNDRSWLLDMFAIYQVENNPNVLSVWFTGQLIPEIEKMPDSIIIKGVMFALDKFFGHMFTLVNPDKILRANWYSNPNFQGTYSYQTIASRKLKPAIRF